MPGVAERGRGRWQVGKGDAAWALVAGPCGASAWVSWAESACWAAREEGLGGSRGRPDWGAGRREREKGGKGLGCLSGFRAGSGWLVGFGFSIFLLFSNSSS